MLVYFTNGARDYYVDPVNTYSRGYWEFLIVLEGHISPSFPTSLKKNFRQKTLWIFPPDCVHGWTGIEGKQAEIMILHFSEDLPELLQLLGDRSFLQCSLNEQQIGHLLAQNKQFELDFYHPGALSSLRYRTVMNTLSLWMCDIYKDHFPSKNHDFSSRIVNQAIAIYAAHMDSGMGINDLSRQMVISPSHLRRLFYKYKGESPQAVMTKLRMDRAFELLTITDNPLLDIAFECGYSCQSSFNKAIQKYWHQTPREIRKLDSLEVNAIFKKSSAAR